MVDWELPDPCSVGISSSSAVGTRKWTEGKAGNTSSPPDTPSLGLPFPFSLDLRCAIRFCAFRLSFLSSHFSPSGT